mgnify:FL=1|tara:strand:+ start:4809 stop:8168 length:3360 start_codon:yes stop_codon:yes gene_type:complete
MPKNDISIEILEEVNNVRIPNLYGGNILSNGEFSNSTSWVLTQPSSSTCSINWSISGGVIIKTAGACSYFEQPLTLVEGRTYEIEVGVKDYNRSGSFLLANHGIGNSNVTVFSSTDICLGCDGNTNQYAHITKQWVQGAYNTNLIRFYAHSSSAMTITYIRVYETIADDSKVMGRLDAATTDDFPLAITFAVNDPSDIDARKGAYSKTFQVPASNNNNQVLKHLNIANSNNLEAILTEKFRCRILVGNLFSLVGLLQIKGVQRLNNKPIYYDVTFLGDNLAWSTFLDGKYLSDLQLANSTDLKLGAKEIVKTWQADSCESSTERDGTNTVNTSPVVYPFVSYGQANETGNEFGAAVQMLRTKYEYDWINNGTFGTPNSSQTGVYGAVDNGGSYAPTPYTSKNPVNDWRPMVWIYNMIMKIFEDVGYTVSSNFMETLDFKKLVYASPNFLFNNPDQRYQANSYLGNFKDDSSCPATAINLRFLNETLTDSISVNDDPATQGGHSGFPECPLQFGGLCYGGSGAGSARFQPATGVIVNQGATLQQDLTVFTGSGFTGWNIPVAGYYKFTTSNIMWGIEFQAQTPTSGSPLTDWSGSGDFSFASDTGIQFFAKIGVQCKTVGETGYCSRETISDGEGQQLTGFLDCNGAYNYDIYETLDPTEYIGYFNKGDQVRFELLMNNYIQVENPAANWTGSTTLAFKMMLWGTTYNNWSASNGTVMIEMYDQKVPVYGGEYNLQDIFPTDQKQIDFVKGVAHCFNLQFNTVEAEKTVYIEPYNDFYLPPSDAIDWTWKLSRNQSDGQHFIENIFSRKIVFKYKLDSADWRVNDMSEQFFDSLGDIYPYQKDLGQTYPSGVKVFENPYFAGTYDSHNRWGITKDNYANNFYSASMWTTSTAISSPKGYGFMPRILLYNKMIMPAIQDPIWQGFWVESLPAAPASSKFSAPAVQVSDVTAYTYGSFPTVDFTNSFYTSATFINRHNYTTQFGLSYGDYWAGDYDAASNTYGDSAKGLGLYSRYYQSMIDGLIDKPKVRICYVDLKISDITQLDFRKMIYIDGVYYRLIKVLDYAPHLNTPTKVELHQYSPKSGSALSNSAIWINNNGTTGGGGGDPVGSGPILDNNNSDG